MNWTVIAFWGAFSLGVLIGIIIGLSWAAEKYAQLADECVDLRVELERERRGL